VVGFAIFCVVLTAALADSFAISGPVFTAALEDMFVILGVLFALVHLFAFGAALFRTAE
jgi:hypothetical protein